MKRITIFFIIFCMFLAIMVLDLSGVSAQDQGSQWSVPYRLSSDGRTASEASLATDQYGYVHIFWTEVLPDNRTIIQYARFDGQNWTQPTDIRVTAPFRPIGSVSPVVDNNGMLHLLWVEGLSGPAFYSRAPAYKATSAQDWPEPLRVNIPAKMADLRVDSQGVLHILYNHAQDPEPGMYYLRSEDQGIRWSDAVWLDPDIPSGYVPSRMRFEVDDTDGLHAVWYYVSIQGEGGDWVRYAHSLDGGNTWPVRFTIDKKDQTSPGLNAFAGPLLAVRGKTVHVIWAAGDLLYRQHRFSTDSGLTWSDPVQLFGGLNGQAWDGVAFDSAGRLHFFGQLRFPQGIYHAYWNQDHWSSPSLIYFIRSSSTDAIINRIHAHNTHPVIRAGNHLVVTFADPPPVSGRRLFVMHRTLGDVSALPTIPTPEPTATLIPQSSSTPTQPITATSTQAVVRQNSEFPDRAPASDSGIWVGVISPVLLICGIVVFRLLGRKR